MKSELEIDFCVCEHSQFPCIENAREREGEGERERESAHLIVYY